MGMKAVAQFCSGLVPVHPVVLTYTVGALGVLVVADQVAEIGSIAYTACRGTELVVRFILQVGGRHAAVIEVPPALVFETAPMVLTVAAAG
jgi:hypothetical protein